jgi:fructose transport system ATP-binding protein
MNAEPTNDESASTGSTDTQPVQPILSGRGLVKTFGKVVGLNGADLDLYPGEVLAVIGDNGAGKSTLIKCFSGAHEPDSGTMEVAGQPVLFRSTHDAREAGIETVFQTLAVSPALDIASNLFLGREIRKPGPAGSILRMLDKKRMRTEAAQHLKALGIGTVQNITQAVETLSGGQRQAVAVARAATFGSKVIILDEPTAALGVRESARVLQLIHDLRERGMPVILISHNMQQVFEVADRIHVQRLGRRAAVVTPQTHTMNEAVAIMTGALTVDESDQALGASPTPA